MDARVFCTGNFDRRADSDDKPIGNKRGGPQIIPIFGDRLFLAAYSFLSGSDPSGLPSSGLPSAGFASFSSRG